MRWSEGKHKWHRWFAWFPQTIRHRGTGEEITIWWEHIARKQIMGNYWPYYVYHPDPNYSGDDAMEKKND